LVIESVAAELWVVRIEGKFSPAARRGFDCYSEVQALRDKGTPRSSFHFQLGRLAAQNAAYDCLVKVGVGEKLDPHGVREV